MAFTNIKRVLIANRGEIACRVLRCCKENNLYSITVYSSEDANAPHASEADESHLLSGNGATAYLDSAQLVQVAIDSDADVVVPGYGFLSENCEFAQALAASGIVFAGPSPHSIEVFGLKHSARELAQENGVPVVPGSGLVDSYEQASAEATRIGFPVMIKSTAGGGGMGLKIVHHESQLDSSLSDVCSRGSTLFKNSGAFLEKYVEHGRHIEVQIFGNGQGDVVAFGERECSIQRRHQKVIEEAPSPFVADFKHEDLRNRLSRCAIQLASSVKYKSAGTVEFLVDNDSGEFYFLEMNTRLQVEHGITELVYDVDLMKLMLLQADFESRGESGLPADLLHQFTRTTIDGIAIPHGWAVECRVYAENPAKNFQPSPGILQNVQFPHSIDNCKVRIDHWISNGTKVSPFFDPLLAKVMVWSPNDRKEAAEAMIKVLQETVLQGPPQNINYLIKILQSENFQTGHTLTSFLNESFEYQPELIEFLQPGAYTTIQDLPGRESFCAGIPLSGPVDATSLQIANLIVGNDRKTEALEISFKGPHIKFYTAATICLAGAPFKFKLGRQDLPMFTAITVPANSVIKIGDPTGEGARAYLAINGGLPSVAPYLGSKSGTPTLNLGGYQGRVLMAGDCLSINGKPAVGDTPKLGNPLPEASRPVYQTDENDVWTIRTLSGPHDTREICSKEGLDMLYNTPYKVNLNSNRGCTRLDGPSEVFSRKDGGDGGSHPSNILEYPYPTCGLSIVGNVASLFGVDGGTLSGFTCICVPCHADWWKMGQAKINAGIRFKPISYKDALELSKQRQAFFADLEVAIKDTEGSAQFPRFTDTLDQDNKSPEELFKTVLFHREADPAANLPEFTIRQAGETMLIVDFDIENFTLLNNGRQKALELEVGRCDPKSSFVRAITRFESTSGASGFVFNPNVMDRDQFVAELGKLESTIPPPHDLKIKSTLYRLPCCFGHSALTRCMERYMHSQRPYASYLPDNVEYVCRANGIPSLKQFKENVIGQTQVVTAVSFFCGNTLTVNLDPRTRFKTGKYNPARTFTPRGAIGSGSVANSIYSIDSPGGYMIWGMTLPDLCWSTYQEQPWFFNNFDQIVYYEVSEEELDRLNTRLVSGKLKLQTEEVTFDFARYSQFLQQNHDDIARVNEMKIEATAQLIAEEEKLLGDWLAETEAAKKASRGNKAISAIDDASTIRVKAKMAANIFKINHQPGSKVSGEEAIIVLEAMKMEIAVKILDDEAGDDESDDERVDPIGTSNGSRYEVIDVVVSEGDIVGPGDTLALLKVV